jgi:NodT family efflux transporter outer membrane factor (OMF) lipoprotein
MLRRLFRLAGLGSLALTLGCASMLGDNKAREASDEVPDSFGAYAKGGGTSAAAQQHWDAFFTDPDLRKLIESALENNQELNIRLQEIIIAKAEVNARRGEYIPHLDARAGVGLEKVGQTTSQGVSDEAHAVPENLADFNFGLDASWEVDVWGRLRKAKKAANYRYLASIEAKNFVVTEIVAEIADSYWDLVALDKQLEILQTNIELQQAALELVIAKKAAARGTQLEVQRFQAEVLKNQGLIFDIERQRVMVENRINFLVGRFPQVVQRNDETFMAPAPDVVATGVPSDLLENRPDVRAASNMLEAAKLDTKSAKARFYPSLSIEAGVGYEAFNAVHLIDTPQSLAYNVAGNLVAPLLNRAAIKADYQAANARQFQAVYEYEKTLLGAFTDVANQLATIEKATQRYERLNKQVAALEDAIEVSNILYRSAHADYMEVLLTRRDYLEAQMELIETKKQQLQALVDVYKALGGGWRQGSGQ